jgi:glutamine synthetase
MVCTIEYIWLGSRNELRSKTKVVNQESITLEALPKWNYDGSSTGQAIGNDSEVIIVPRKLFRDPFSTSNSHLVMCDTYEAKTGNPLKGNNRHGADVIFQKDLSAKPWFGLEQEYFLINPNTNKPLGFPHNGNPNPQGQYYCSVGAENAFGREIASKHLSACIKAGIQVSGMNAEVAPGQWEFQVGPVEGIDAGDHLWVARYLLLRIAEAHNVLVDFEPKPVSGDWNGSGCHCNFSTVAMRDGTDQMTGLEHIELAIERLSKKHDEHMAVYGTGNELRMTGEHETSRYDQFSSGRANRGASVRIGNETINDKKGYFEDRRPSSNCDPYLVTSILFNTSQFE